METEISPLEYARSNQLSLNYLADRTGLIELQSFQRAEMRKNLNISDDSHLSGVNFGPDLLIEERLIISKDAAKLIESTTCLEIPEKINSHILNLLEKKKIASSLKCEFPLLQSDHETDSKKFKGREDFEIGIQSVKLPLEEVDEQKNQGLTWSSELWSLSQKLINKLKSEKLCVSKGVLSYLQNSREFFWTSDNSDLIFYNQMTYKRSFFRDPVTPPLSPIRTPFHPYQPSSSDSIQKIPLLSDPISPTEQELQGLESIIFRQDANGLSSHSITHSCDSHNEQACYMSYVKISDICSPFKNQEDSPKISRLKREYLKVDENLTPESCAPEYPKSTELESILEVSSHDPNNNQDLLEFDCNFAEETFLPAYKVTTQKVEQEDLIEADVLCRVDVPNMDFSKVEPPWKIFEKATLQNTAASFLESALLNECIKNGDSLWSELNLTNDKLNWDPFPGYIEEKCIKEDKIQQDDSIWDDFIPPDDSNSVLSSSSVVWKHEGLSIVKEDNKYEETICFCYSHETIPGSISSLVKKRKLQIEEKKAPNPQKYISENSIADQACSSQLSPEIEQPNNFGNSHSLGLLSGAFSARNAVDNYLQIRGSKRRKLTECPYFNTNGQEKQVPQDFRIGVQKGQTTAALVQLSPQQNYAILPAPSLCQKRPASVILASSLLERRLLIKKVEELLPQLKLVERDFSVHKTVTNLRENVANTQNFYPLANEADIIVSPITGFILTTLQKIKQKPLPGHKTQSAIRVRLNSIRLKYENIIVFVSEGRADKHATRLDVRDCLALSELTSFTVSLFKFATVLYIGGGEETLAQWLASFIQIYQTPGLALLQDETYWEIFLRRAGLNPFAAQVIIADLKKKRSLDVTESGVKERSELIDFVEMGAEQRVYHFGHLVGTVAMEKLNKLIDSTWNI